MKYRNNTIWIAAVVLAATLFSSIDAAKFGFRTCAKSVDKWANSPNKQTIYYQWAQQRYTCVVGPVTHGQAYTCDTAKIKSSEACEGANFIQLNHMGKDDVCIGAIIVNGKEINVKDQRMGDDVNKADGAKHDKSEGIKEVYKRRYTMSNGKPKMTRPAGYGKVALVKPACTKRPQKSCKAIDIDHFLLDCSAEFKKNEKELGSIQGKLTSMTKAMNGVKASLKPVNGKIATLTKNVNAVKAAYKKADSNLNTKVDGVRKSLTSSLNSAKAAFKKADANLNTKVNGVKKSLTASLNGVKAAYKKADATLTKSVNGVKASLKPVNGKIATLTKNVKALTGRIAKLEKHLDEIGGGFKAQSAPMDVLDYNNAPRDAFGGYSDLVIISLVIFNIGTVLACVSCLYWNKKARGVEIFDELEK